MPTLTPLRQARSPSFSTPQFRASLGMFATGVTIVTARDAQGQLVGLTANSFNSVSLSPPLVLWSLSQAASSMEAFATGSHYAINILSAEQQELAKRFAAKNVNRYADVEFTEGSGGAPLLAVSIFCHSVTPAPGMKARLALGEAPAESNNRLPF